MTWVAGDRPCIEMGSRRTHESSAVAAARAAYIAGFAATSNLEAGRTYGIPTTGTSAHSFTLLHDSEREAFEAQIRALGPGTTLLVDTYDVPEAIRTDLKLTQKQIGTRRLSGSVLCLPALTSWQGTRTSSRSARRSSCASSSGRSSTVRPSPLFVQSFTH